jgi:hypothetical protein
MFGHFYYKNKFHVKLGATFSIMQKLVFITSSLTRYSMRKLTLTRNNQTSIFLLNQIVFDRRQDQLTTVMVNPNT